MPSIPVPLESEVSLPELNTPVPKPPSFSFQHAAPWAPWPWIDVDDNLNEQQMQLVGGSVPAVSNVCNHQSCNDCWKQYPESHFPNWTNKQVYKSKIAELLIENCSCYHIDVDSEGRFGNLGKFSVEPGKEGQAWRNILTTKRPSWSRTRAIFIEDLSGPMLQMLGTRYHIGPSFFSSSLNWIPCHYQEEIKPGVGDHLTIVLPYLRSVSVREMTDFQAAVKLHSDYPFNSESFTRINENSELSTDGDCIDTKAPLKLSFTDRHLCLDLLSLHVIRNVKGSTIISYHPTLDTPTTRAEELLSRISDTGQRSYWHKRFRDASDPTLLLLTFLWQAMHSWQQAMHYFDNDIRQHEYNMIFTGAWRSNQDLHRIRAHQLFYTFLLDEFSGTIKFIHQLQNPTMASVVIREPDKISSQKSLKHECEILIHQVNRLARDLRTQEQRLLNMAGLVSHSSAISENMLIRGGEETFTGNNAILKPILYLITLFLPLNLAAGIFGMNISVISPWTGDGRYAFSSLVPAIATLIVVITLVFWIAVAIQTRRNGSFLERLAWPFFFFRELWYSQMGRTRQARHFPVERTLRDDQEDELGRDNYNLV